MDRISVISNLQWKKLDFYVLIDKGITVQQGITKI